MEDRREILIVAGEPSADLHAAALVRELVRHHPSWTFFGLGGECLKQAGAEICVPMEDVTVMGFSEVVAKLPAVFRAFRRLERSVWERLPDAAILLDFPDFNLRLARRLKRAGIPILYYISPQVWAWRRGRVRLIRRVVDRMIVILPFEKRFYEAHGVPVDYVGHPLVQRGEAASSRQNNPAAFRPASTAPSEREIVVALLPGSREQEFDRCLSPMLDAVELLRREGLRVRGVVCVADAVRHLAPRVAVGQATAVASQNELPRVLSEAEAALVVSGTATLVCALHRVPMVVVYRTSWLSYLIARLFVHVPFISLVNLVAERRLVDELIQHRATPEAMAASLRVLLVERERAEQVRRGLDEVVSRLGEGDATARAAAVVTRFLTPGSQAEAVP
ncbi:MAG: lipid-A-disaccharide synthase [Nitrospirae bacterium]|nr:lipid-A-disaccharide synthase [Nitrospirota bacterium]